MRSNSTGHFLMFSTSVRWKHISKVFYYILFGFFVRVGFHCCVHRSFFVTAVWFLFVFLFVSSNRKGLFVLLKDEVQESSILLCKGAVYISDLGKGKCASSYSNVIVLLTVVFWCVRVHACVCARMWMCMCV